ncbi:winged helix-turn-helix transcriptional regulator [Prauserella cavernicola]|uniref:winged helix-turn-helix transcriptional regulator n=1 Tax=Prauserella cavernicola TaxID=2800127 RepID=UPI001907244F|nr:helix-turn-helix domain-containing protein [Prauserella cavernicola]
MAWRDADEADCKHASHVLEVVGQRWSPSILLALARGAERFTDITTAVTGLSARMLTLRLTQLEASRLVERTVVPTMPVTIRYRLTPRGADLVTALRPIADYVHRWETDSDQDEQDT